MNAITSLLTRRTKADRIATLEREVFLLRSSLHDHADTTRTDHQNLKFRVAALEEDVENLREPE
jgi:hypothetical protein